MSRTKQTSREHLANEDKDEDFATAMRILGVTDEMVKDAEQKIYTDNDIINYAVSQSVLYGHDKFNLICLRPTEVIYTPTVEFKDLFDYIRAYHRNGWVNVVDKTIDEELERFDDQTRLNDRKCYLIFFCADENDRNFGLYSLLGFTDEGYEDFLSEISLAKILVKFKPVSEEQFSAAARPSPASRKRAKQKAKREWLKKQSEDKKIADMAEQDERLLAYHRRKTKAIKDGKPWPTDGQLEQIDSLPKRPDNPGGKKFGALGRKYTRKQYEDVIKEWKKSYGKCLQFCNVDGWLKDEYKKDFDDSVKQPASDAPEKQTVWF
jgi:glycosyltransferase involved in cell wall biosynthesis